MPRSTYLAVALVFLLGVLNFLPLPFNHNWFKLEGAPTFSLSDADRVALQQALELLQKAEALNPTDLSEKLAQILRALQDGSMSKDQMSRSLAELQQALAERGLDSGKLLDGLELVAKALEPSPMTRPTASEIFELDLKGAAQEVRELAEKLNATPESALREMAERFQEAANVAGQGLERLSQNMRETADAMRRGDRQTAERGLQQTAQELDRLQRVLDSQRLRAEASAALSEVQESVGGTPGEVAQGEGEGEGEGQGEGEGEGQGQGAGEGAGEGAGQGEGQGEGEGVGKGEGDGGEGQGQGEGEGEGEGEGDGEGQGEGRGGKQAGKSGPFPMRGDPTSLETQLDKEPLPVRPTRGSRPETIEEASQRERSKLDYRNVKSNLTPAQRDALNQDPIPFEQRQFVKEYMESVRP